MLTVAVNGNEADGGMSDGIDIAYGQNDTLRVLGWEASGVGEYTFDYTVASDSTDEYPADNVAQQAIEVVELQYGRDNGEFVGQTPADGTVDFIAGVPYDAVNDMTIYAIDVAIMDGSDVGAEVVCHLFDWVEWNNGGGQYDGLLTTTEEVQLEANFLNSGDGEVSWYTFALEEPYEVAAGEAVMACFRAPRRRQRADWNQCSTARPDGVHLWPIRCQQCIRLVLHDQLPHGSLEPRPQR